MLIPGGRVFLEIGVGQAAATCALLLARGFVAAEARRDLAGIERVVMGVRQDA